MSPITSAYLQGAQAALAEDVTKTAEEKQAIIGTILHGLGTAFGGHVGTNALGRAAHHGSNIAEVLAHKGFQHGQLGQQINPVRKQVMKLMFGPEALIPYEAAHQAGSHAVARYGNPVDRANALRSMSRGVGLAGSAAQEAPVFKNIHQAVQHELAGTEPTLQAQGWGSRMYGKLVNHLSNQVDTGFETGAQKVVNAVKGGAPAVPLVAADAALSGGVPLGAAGHLGWNYARQRIGDTNFGRKMMVEELGRGLKGQVPSKGQEMAYDLMVSPAFLDARRTGQVVHQTAPVQAKAIAHALPKEPTREGFGQMAHTLMPGLAGLTGGAPSP